MKLLVIDGNSIMNRAFYGIRTLTNSEGVNTNALYGFLTTLHRHLMLLIWKNSVRQTAGDTMK